MELSFEQSRMKTWATVLAYLHLGAGTSYLLLWSPLLKFCNYFQEQVLGGGPFWEPIGLPTERFWFSLSISMMYMLAFLAWECSKDPVKNLGQMRTFIVSKAVSTVFFITFFFVDARAFAYIVGILVDGSLFALVLWLYTSTAASLEKKAASS